MLVDMIDINKEFSGNQVLKKASFNLKKGEIHALMGENGAGKSTLMKILTGVYSKNSGKILINGVEVNYKHPKEAEKDGIIFIYQELNVIYDMTVLENMFLCKEIKNKFGFVSNNLMEEKVKSIFSKLGVKISTSKIMRDLSIGQQQVIEIAKALMIDAKVIIMDEPTATLTPSETAFLFEIIKNLKADGVSIVYISHRMEEIFELCDRITILRDGVYVSTKQISQTDMNDVIKMMIGRDMGERFPQRKACIGEVIFSANNITAKKYFENINFEVKKGEILGFSGLMGAGRSEIMNAIFGNIHIESGKLKIEGNEVVINCPAKAKKLGIGFITEDRKSEGLMIEESIKDNISLPNLEQISTKGFVIKKSLEKWLSEKAIKSLSIKCFDEEQLCKNLSGGNQQKVVFAKWIFTNPKILILDEPTRGVDIGAKKEIYDIINKLAEHGVAIIMVSSELPEILGMSDRIAVIHEGKLSGILEKKDATQENIMILATGGELL